MQNFTSFAHWQIFDRHIKDMVTDYEAWGKRKLKKSGVLNSSEREWNNSNAFKNEVTREWKFGRETNEF